MLKRNPMRIPNSQPRRATEIAQRDIDSGEGRSETDEDDDDDGSLVRMEHVTRAHDEMFCSPRVTAIRSGTEASGYRTPGCKGNKMLVLFYRLPHLSLSL